MLFWERFYNLCLEQGKKPNTVCSELGYSTAIATHWKNGTVPKGDVLLILSDYFDVSVDYLLGKTDTKEVAKSNKDIDKFSQHFKKLNDESKKQALDYLEYLIDKQEKNSD